MNFNEQLEHLKHTDAIYLQKKIDGASNLTLGKVLGKAAERGIKNMIKDFKSIKLIEVEILCANVDKFSRTDLIITLPNDKKLYCPIVKDLWSQTAQMSRLEAYWWKIKYWKLIGLKIPNCIYLVHADLDAALNKVHKANTVRAKEIQKILKELVDEGFVMDMNRFIPKIKNNEFI